MVGLKIAGQNDPFNLWMPVFIYIYNKQLPDLAEFKLIQSVKMG